MTTDVSHRIAILTARIKQRRKQLGLTQAQVAARCGIKQSNYSRMESGRQTPNLETLFTILTTLQMDLQYTNAGKKVYHIMHEDDAVADVVLSDDRKDISFIKFMPDGLKQPFSGNTLDLERFYRFLKSRCYDDGRADLDDILKKAGFHDNNPYDWVLLTHGAMYDDFFWIKTDHEEITWDEVRIR